MKLSKVIIRNFKRFGKKTVFNIPDNILVVVGHNNCGKTTLLQAIATWNLALDLWIEQRNFNATGRRGAYHKAKILLQDFSSLPLQNFDMLWSGASPINNPIEITLVINNKPLTMEILYHSPMQIFARPQNKTPKSKEAWEDHIEKWKEVEREMRFLPDPNQSDLEFVKPIKDITLVSAMSGIALEETQLNLPKIRQILGEGKPGDVLRNLLAEAAFQYLPDKTKLPGGVWSSLYETVEETFGYRMIQPDPFGAKIRAQYADDSATFDISAAGSGFLQTLMLFVFLTINKNSILLLDEPDSHLHIQLQTSVFAKLQELAIKNNNTLIVATHSEHIINSTKLKNLCVLLETPQMLISNDDERKRIVNALAYINNFDITIAQGASGILYVEGYTDIDILRKWAQVLQHPLLNFLRQPFWKPASLEADGSGIKAEKHFDAIKLARQDIVGVDLRDKDKGEKVSYQLYTLQNGLQRFFWRRYEIESYLIHPESIANFISQKGKGSSAAKKALKHMEEKFSASEYKDPLKDHEYFKRNKGKRILSHIFEAAGMQNFDDYAQLAAAMPKEAIHPEVKEKLDAIAKAFGIMEP